MNDAPKISNRVERRALIEAVIASTIGTTIEWYDFFLVGIAAATVVRRLFFPDVDPFLGQMAAFSTYLVGFIARPIGGAVFGWMGDRIGRKSTLVTTLLMMGISTVLMGLLPTHQQIGVLAPLLLVALRFVQGLGVGGEWGGSVLLALEYGHRGKRGFYASWPQAGVPLGLIASFGIVAFIERQVSPEDFLAWGWRIPFLLSGLLIAVGLLIRVRILETPLFVEVQQANQVAQAPIRETLVRHWRELLLAGGCRISENACFYLFSVYVLYYGEEVLGVDRGVLLNAVCLAGGLQLITIPLYGILSDHWTRKGVYILGSVLLAGLAVPYFALLDTRIPALIILATVVILNFSHAMLYSVQASLIPELFGTRLRYTGASIGYQLGAPFGGGLAPIIAASLVRAFPGSYWPLATYVIGISFLSLVCVLMLAETSKKDISAED